MIHMFRTARPRSIASLTFTATLCLVASVVHAQGDTVARGNAIDAETRLPVPGFQYHCTIFLLPDTAVQRDKQMRTSLRSGEFFCLWRGLADSVDRVGTIRLAIIGRPGYQSVTDTICQSVPKPCTGVIVSLSRVREVEEGPGFHIPWAMGSGTVRFRAGLAFQVIDVGSTVIWPEVLAEVELWGANIPVRGTVSVLSSFQGLAALGGTQTTDTITYLGEARVGAATMFGSASAGSVGIGGAAGVAALREPGGKVDVGAVGSVYGLGVITFGQVRLYGRFGRTWAQRTIEKTGYPRQSWQTEVGLSVQIH